MKSNAKIMFKPNAKIMYREYCLDVNDALRKSIRESTSNVLLSKCDGISCDFVRASRLFMAEAAAASTRRREF